MSYREMLATVSLRLLRSIVLDVVLDAEDRTRVDKMGDSISRLSVLMNSEISSGSKFGV